MDFWICLLKGNVWLTLAVMKKKKKAIAQVSQEKPWNPVWHLQCPVFPLQSLPRTPVPWNWRAEEHICKENICSITILELAFHLEAKCWHLPWGSVSKSKRNYGTYADTGGQNTLVCSHLLVITGNKRKKGTNVSARNQATPCIFCSEKQIST